MLGQLAPAKAGPDHGGWSWADVPGNYWAKRAVDLVAHKNSWMEDYGSTHFRPNTLETRKYLAHAMVLAWAPNELPDPLITFKDLAPTDPFWRYANVAVKNHWIPRIKGAFLPDQPVTMTDVHKAIVEMLGLQDVAVGIDHFHTTNGYVFKHYRAMGDVLIGMLLGLRFNHSNDSLDVHPREALPRSEVAWSIYQAYLVQTQYNWKIGSIRSDGYKNLHVGRVTPAIRKMIEFGLRYVGYPYIYAAEWGSRTPPGYCCGAQTTGGFDCSGLTWWLMKSPSGGWNNAKMRGYWGWPLPQRSSMDMAAAGRRIPFKQAHPGDLMLFNSGGGSIDHVDVYLGYGWAFDSSDGVGGVTVLHVGNGWYRDHFVFAHRIIRPPSK